MAEETSNISIPTEQFMYVVERMTENEKFLFNNAQDTVEEVVELINDAIDTVQRAESIGEYTERSMVFFIHHIFMPTSYAIYVDVLTANLPVCYMELRLILESLVKCYLADSRYSQFSFFQKRLDALEQEKQSISKLMKELGEEAGLGGQFFALWGKLSRDWVHTQGFVSHVVDRVTKKSDIPPWALVVPMSYVESDLDDINELRRRISQLRNLPKITMERYKQRA
jgi:hypothetical protein